MGGRYLITKWSKLHFDWLLSLNFLSRTGKLHLFTLNVDFYYNHPVAKYSEYFIFSEPPSDVQNPLGVCPVIIFVIWYNGNWQLTYFHIISIWILFNHCYDIICSLFAHCVTARFGLCFHILSIYIFMNQFDDLTLYSPTNACLCLWCVCFVVLCVCVAFMNEYVLPSCVEYKVMNV